MPNLSGQYLGRYHLIEQLGEGGMAVVYRAYDTRLEREVAVKIIRQSAFPPEMMEGVLKRFEREAKSLARLSHPNIVKVHDFGEHEGSPFLVLEYLPGGTLKEKLGKPLPWPEAMRLLLPIVRGIAYAHERGIIHRDIKPANILISESGEPMLSDFGIAKILEMGQMTALTGSGMAIGTPEYMAPEQWTGETSPQSDLYSLGIVLYEMITGRKPYVADTPAAILLKQATEPLPRPSQFASGLPESVEWVLVKTLARNPEDRYKDVKALVEAMESLSPVPVIPLPPQQPGSLEPSNLQTVQLQEVTIQTPKPDETKPDFIHGLSTEIANSYLNFKSQFVGKPTSRWFDSLKSSVKFKKSALLVSGLIFFMAVIGFALNRYVTNPTLFFSGMEAGKVNIYAYDGKNLTKITQASEGTRNWSPDSGFDQNIYFVSDRDGKAEIYRINQAGKVERLTHTPGQAESWSPASSFDGKLYFTSNRDGKAEIYRINQTGEVGRVTNTPGQAESWSPASSLDGNLYFTSNRDGKAEIYRIDQAGEVARITHTPEQAESWSPASSLHGNLYFTSNRDGKAEIYRIDQAGEAERLTDTPGQAESWAPVVLRQNIYFTSDRSGRDEIYLLGTQTVAISNLESWTKQSQREDNLAR
jgi:serine/threonine protein kinase